MELFDLWDLIVGGILLVVIIGILIGKGQEVLTFFKGRSAYDPNRPKYDPKKEEFGILIFCLVELAVLLLFRFIGPLWPAIYLVGIAVTILAIIFIVKYFKKIEIK